MNHEMHKPKSTEGSMYKRPEGTPVGDGWTRTGNYFTKELPTGGIQKLSLQEWEKMNASKGHKETVGKGLELLAQAKIREEALESARKTLSKEFGGIKPGDKDTTN